MTKKNLRWRRPNKIPCYLKQWNFLATFLLHCGLYSKNIYKYTCWSKLIFLDENETGFTLWVTPDSKRQCKTYNNTCLVEITRKHYLEYLLKYGLACQNIFLYMRLFWVVVHNREEYASLSLQVIFASGIYNLPWYTLVSIVATIMIVNHWDYVIGSQWVVHLDAVEKK